MAERLPGSFSQTAPDAQINANDAVTYWNSVDSTVKGMLGGFPQVSRIDLQSSSIFLSKLKRKSKTTKPNEQLPLALDCGAGIGRITMGLLVNHCQQVDIVEPVKKFTDQLLIDADKASHKDRVGKIFNVGLEDFHPDSKRIYNLIWNQWCLGQLTDEAFVAYLERCKAVLAPDGWIIVKENLSTNPDDTDEFDETDSSVTRSEMNWEKLFEKAGLKTIAKEKQRGFPASLGLLPVCSWALRPLP